MRTVILGPRPPQIEALIESRRATGADRYDEVWAGEYHMAPAPRKRHALLESRLTELLAPIARDAGPVLSGAFNLGTEDDYRIPDLGIHRDSKDCVFAPTASLVVDVVSPDDESMAKLPFYAAHSVEEVVVADPGDRRVTWLRLDDGRYRPVDRSTVLDFDIDDIASQIEWPPSSDD